MNTWKANFVSKILNDRATPKFLTTEYKMTFIEKIEAIIFNPFFIALFILAMIMGASFWVSYEEVKNCSKFENKIVHQDAWTQFVWSGKIMTTVFHPAGDYYRNVCVQAK